MQTNEQSAYQQSTAFSATDIATNASQAFVEGANSNFSSSDMATASAEAFRYGFNAALKELQITCKLMQITE